jgi:hypothetical protein
MHELQIEDCFSLPFQSFQVHFFVGMLCAYMEMFVYFFIVTFTSLFRIFNILHLPKWS